MKILTSSMHSQRSKNYYHISYLYLILFCPKVEIVVVVTVGGLDNFQQNISFSTLLQSEWVYVNVFPINFDIKYYEIQYYMYSTSGTFFSVIFTFFF